MKDQGGNCLFASISEPVEEEALAQTLFWDLFCMGTCFGALLSFVLTCVTMRQVQKFWLAWSMEMT